MFDFIHDAGLGIFPVLAFGAITLAIAVRHILRPQNKNVITVKWLMALTVVAGMLGTVRGVQTSAHHITGTPDKWLFLLGLDESLNNLVAALVVVALAMLAMLVAHVRQGGSSDEAGATAPSFT